MYKEDICSFDYEEIQEEMKKIGEKAFQPVKGLKRKAFRALPDPADAGGGSSDFQKRSDGKIFI